MTVKRKIILVLALPICGLAAFVLFSFFEMRGVSAGMRTASGDTFLPILKTDIPEMNRLRAGIGVLLNADRDAYQAFLAETNAATTTDTKELQKADRDNQENITQVQQRLTEASGAFNTQMQPLYEEFRKNFQSWQSQSRKVVTLSAAALEQHHLILKTAAEGDKLFADMRETINQICDIMEKDMADPSRSVTSSQAERVHRSMAMLLNADRDAYQAFLAQTQIPLAETEEKIAALDKDNADNIKQIEERTTKASEVFNLAAKAKYDEFKNLVAQWKVKSRQIVKAAATEFKLRQQHQKVTASAAVAFDAMRDNIDKLGNEMENRIKALAANMDKQGIQATGALDIMAGSMSKATVLFVIIGLVLIVLPLVMGIMCVRSIVKPLERAVGVADAVSRGDFSRRMNLNTNDEIGILGRAIDRVPETLEKIDLQFSKLSQAAEEGDLSFRGNPAEFDGAYREIIEIVNKTLDNIARPVEESLRVLDGLQVNDLSNAIDIRGFKGDYLRIATAVNQVRARLLNIQRTIVNIAAGDLKDLPEYEKIGRRSEKDQLMPAFVSMMRSLARMIEDIEMMAEAGQKGNLDARAEESVHSGAYRTIVESVNKLMTAVTGPLREVGKVMETVSAGDLTRRVSGNYDGEFARLKNNINTSVDSIDSALQQVTEAVSQVNAGSVQISDASQSLSQGATEQAASLEEISSSLNEIGSQVNANAVNAGKSNDFSRNARTNAERGYEEMKSMVAAMHDINQSSQEIAKIIKIIDEIAFQTNLLALNAAVEAARAGIHGKGFAVVAEEVRNLAGRSAKAAHETAEMIESSLGKVEKGLNIVENSAQSFEKIVGNITEVSEIGGGIAEACTQQAEGISQINQGLAQIDQVTQQNTAHAEQTAAAAEELAGQSTHLQSLINHFKVSSR